MTESFGAFFKSLFSAQGRISRSRFWVVVFVVWITGATGGLVVGFSGEGLFTALMPLVWLPVFIGGFVAGVFNAVKRLHDLGRSGWRLLLIFALYVPLAVVAEIAGEAGEGGQAFGALLQFVFAVAYLAVVGGVPGQRGANRFGEPPGGAAAPVESPA
jgi:uncharacterized membrane protein YhaH (DUF805 family)